MRTIVAPTQSQCEHCGESYARAHGNRKYCSKLCGMRAYHESRKAAGRSLNRTRYERSCEYCGITWTTEKRDARYCSQACISRATADTRTKGARRKKAAPPATQCAWCLALHFTTRKFCSTDCERSASERNAAAQRSPLRAAYETQDWQATITAVRQHCRLTESGCWEWTRRANGGYPVARMGRRQVHIHRIVLEAKHGKPLGSQHAHHICANTMCVNPEHLQPVTHRDNVAEMMARNSYLARIAELEQALAELAPDHPLLHVIEVA